MTKPMPALLAATALLAACATSKPEASAGEATADASPASCNADAANAFIGKLADDATLDDARKAAGARTARMLKPGQAVTMEYLGDRLNLYLDAGGKIERIGCG